MKRQPKGNAGTNNVTTDHDEIRMWVEERGGSPSVVPSTHGEEGSGLLRIDFPGGATNLEHVSWDEFFRIFDENNLAFLYQEKTKDGKQSRFNKFISADTGRMAGNE